MKNKARETYKAIFGKQYCRKCGLVALNNPFSIWAREKGCYNEYHPQYNQKRKLTNPFK